MYQTLQTIQYLQVPKARLNRFGQSPRQHRSALVLVISVLLLSLVLAGQPIHRSSSTIFNSRPVPTDPCCGQPDVAPWLQIYVDPITGYTNYNLTTTDTAADDTSPLTVMWNWGDGSASAAVLKYASTWSCTYGNGVCYNFYVNYNHAYKQPGNYTIILTLTDTAGLSRSYNRQVSITNPPPPPSPLPPLSGGRAPYVV